MCSAGYRQYQVSRRCWMHRLSSLRSHFVPLYSRTFGSHWGSYRSKTLSATKLWPFWNLLSFFFFDIYTLSQLIFWSDFRVEILALLQISIGWNFTEKILAWNTRITSLRQWDGKMWPLHGENCMRCITLVHCEVNDCIFCSFWCVILHQ